MDDAFFISVSRTAMTTILNLILTSMLAFSLSRKEYVLRRFITTMLVLTMYVPEHERRTDLRRRAL